MSASKWKAYPNYTDAKFEFIPQYPSHWEMKRMQWIGQFSASGIDKKSVETESDCLMVNYTDVYGSETAEVSSDQDFMKTTATREKIAEHHLEKGDILFTPSSETSDDIGVSAVATEDMPDVVYSYHLTRFRPSIPLGVDFSRFFCNSVPVLSQLSAVARGTTRQILSRADFNTLIVAIPPVEERMKIAYFLSKRTKQITATIIHLDSILSLLEEKRSALTKQAVTKGLDSEVAMVESGVEWLGQIPCHWTFKRTRFLCEITTGGRDTQDAEDDGEFPFFVRSPHVEQISTYSFDGEAVLTSGDGAGVGKIFHHHIGKLDFHQRVYLFSDFNQLKGRLFYHYIKENLETVVLSLSAKSTVDSIRLPMLQNFPIAYGPEEEQMEILNHVERGNALTNQLVEKTRRIITLLEEYRTAIISAAVTGKIDVRESV